MVSWLKRLWTWIKEPRLFWLCVIVLIPLTLSALLPSPSELRLRVVGLILQLCGIGTVAWGLSETRRLFGHPSIFESAQEWFRGFPPFRLKTITGTMMGGLANATISARGELWDAVGEEATLEERVSALERNLISVNQKTNDLQNHIDSEVRTRQKEITEEKTSREKADHDIQHKLELTETGGVRLSLVGLIWLCYGLILSAIPNEIIRFFF